MIEEYGLSTEVEEGYDFATPDDEEYQYTDEEASAAVADAWAVDHEADEQTVKDALPPKGWYLVRLTPGERGMQTVDGTKLPVQPFFGIGEQKKDEKAHKARIRVYACPRKFIRVTGKTYWNYLQYVALGKAYADAHEGQKHESYDALEAFLADTAIEAYVNHTKDNDYMVTDFRAVRKEVSF